MIRRLIHGKNRHILQQVYESEKPDLRIPRPFAQLLKAVDYLQEPTMVEPSGLKVIVLASLC